MTLNTNFAEPYDETNPDDVKAVDTSVQFAFGWFMDPLAFGKYPQIMID
jgi:beta-glucosidase